MLEITKRECEYLEKNGAKWHDDLHRSYSSAHKLYITESPKMKKMLNAYRQSVIVEKGVKNGGSI